MGGSFSDYWENVILDHMFGTSEHSATSIWIALCTAAPNDSTNGSTLKVMEVATTKGYSRQLCETWATADGGSMANAQSETFTQASSNWGEVTHFALVDKAGESSGNMLAWGSLDVMKNIQSGDTAKFAAGDINIVLT